MPLVQGSSQADISKNIETEKNAGRSQAQSVAIAMHTAKDNAQPPLATTPNSGVPQQPKSKHPTIDYSYSGPKRRA